MAIRFSDGSTRRPDISIFASPLEPTYEATRKLPEAVVEVVSPGSEVKDMIVFDPQTGSVAHFRRDGRFHLASPAEIALECG